MLKGNFWLHFWFPPPLIPVGPPDRTQQTGIIQNQMLQLGQRLAQEGNTNGAAFENLNQAGAAIDNATFVGLLGGNRGALFREMRRFFQQLRAARRTRQRTPGVPREDLVDIEMQALSLVSQEPLDIMVNLDRAGATVDDRDLLKAMRAMYGFSGQLDTIGRRGFRANYIGALNRLKRAFKFVDRAANRQVVIRKR